MYNYVSAMNARMQAHVSVKYAENLAAKYTGRSAAYWRREARRRRRHYRHIKELTFGAVYGSGPVKLAP